MSSHVDVRCVVRRSAFKRGGLQRSMAADVQHHISAIQVLEVVQLYQLLGDVALEHLEWDSKPGLWRLELRRTTFHDKNAQRAAVSQLRSGQKLRTRRHGNGSTHIDVAIVPDDCMLPIQPRARWVPPQLLQIGHLSG